MSFPFKLPARYSTPEPLNAGGMGEVYTCTDKNLKRKVALKIIRNRLLEKSLLIELEALQTIRSKHVVQVYEYIRKDGYLCIVEEFIDGKEIEKVPGSECLKIFYQLASAISEIHAHGIIHRDIKNNNVKLNSENVLKVYDFGLAKNMDYPKTKGFSGTHVFAAPELYTDNSLTISPEIDVYAFGITCAFFFLGEDTFYERVIGDRPPYELNFNFNEFTQKKNLAEVLNSCIQNDPNLRPTMKKVFRLLKNEMLFGKKRASLFYLGQVYKLDKIGKFINVKRENIGEVKIQYDGYNFYAENPKGEVFINAGLITETTLLPPSCLIALGNEHRTFAERVFVPFDSTHPEVTV